MFTNRSATKIAEMCFLVPKMNSDSLGASQLANMKQVAACNIQISRGALNRLDRSRCLSASMITTVPQFGWKNKSPLIEHKTSRIPKSLRSLSLFPPTIWCLERRNISTCAAKLAGRILKKKSYQQLTELTSSWQVTGIYFPQWWLTVLIFQRAAAVHQSQQQMAIMHLSH